MIIYLANNKREKGIKDLLTSYAYISKTKKKQQFKELQKDGFFLDSGAYTAWTKGKEINIQEYISFIKEHEHQIDVYANLDVIGDAKGTLKNQKIMEKAGLNPLPCFHQGENYKYLERYIEEYDYIALGGLTHGSGVTSSILTIFKDYICGEDLLPKIKVHGFGVTSFDLLFNCPWYSVDSTTWRMAGVMGEIIIPICKGKEDYTKVPNRVTISSKSSKTKTARHFSKFTPAKKELFIKYIESKGENPEKLAEDNNARDRINIQYFKDLKDNMKYPKLLIASKKKGFNL